MRSALLLRLSHGRLVLAVVLVLVLVPRRAGRPVQFVSRPPSRGVGRCVVTGAESIAATLNAYLGRAVSVRRWSDAREDFYPVAVGTLRAYMARGWTVTEPSGRRAVFGPEDIERFALVGGCPVVTVIRAQYATLTAEAALAPRAGSEGGAR